MNKDRINYIYAKYDELTWTKEQKEKFLTELKMMNMTSVDPETKEKIDTLIAKLSQVSSVGNNTERRREKRKKLKNKNAVNDDELERQVLEKVMDPAEEHSRNFSISILMLIVVIVLVGSVAFAMMNGIISFQFTPFEDLIPETGGLVCVREHSNIIENGSEAITTRTINVQSGTLTQVNNRMVIKLPQEIFINQIGQESRWESVFEPVERMEIRVEFNPDDNEIIVIQEQSGRLAPRNGFTTMRDFQSHYENEGYTCN